MEANDDLDHLIPDLTILWGLSLDRWINFFILVSVVSSLCYTFLVVNSFPAPDRASAGGVSREDFQPRNIPLRIVGILMGVSLAMARLKFESRLRKNGNRERGLAWDPIDWLVGFFLYGLGVEAAALLWTGFVTRAVQRRRSISDLSSSSNNCTDPKPRFPNHLLRFSWFLLYAGSTCLTNFCVNRRDHNFEYYGPMRLTRPPRLHRMDTVYPYTDEMQYLPRLGCILSDDIRKNGLEQPYIEATVEIGWGRQWGCRDLRDDKERWNTNWPSIPQCTTFLCSSGTTSSDADACPCHSSEEDARDFTWTCLNAEFLLTQLQANETFDRNQPPWDDPSWPALWRYGSCDRAVGTSMDPIYVRKVEFNGQRQQSFGLVLLTFWFLLVVKMVIDWNKNG